MSLPAPLTRRRLVGAGVLAAGGAAAAGGVLWRDRGGLGGGERLAGVAGVEKRGLLQDAQVRAALGRAGFALDADFAPALGPVPAGARWLWPATSLQVALNNAAPIREAASASALTSPLVLYSWASIADALVRAGLARRESGRLYADGPGLLRVQAEGRSWSSLGVDGPGGPVRIMAPNPARTALGLLFAAWSLTQGAAAEVLRPSFNGVADDVEAGYLTGRPVTHPLLAAFEHTLLEHVAADPAGRARQQAASGGALPVALHLRPTLLADHPVVALDPSAQALAAAVTSPDVLKLAWTRHGLRGPGGAAAVAEGFTATASAPAQVQTTPPPDTAELARFIKTLRG